MNKISKIFISAVAVVGLSGAGFVSAHGNDGYGGGVCGTPVTAPSGGFKITVEYGDSNTHEHTVTLSLKGGNAARMKVSNDASFSGATSESYKTSRQWTLSSGNGTRTVYVKFYNVCGQQATATVSDSILVSSHPKLGKHDVVIDELIGKLHYGQTDPRVALLQEDLRDLGLMPRGWTLTNYYGNTTLAGVGSYLWSLRK